jgi:gliding motility-associated-like protein
VGTIQWFTNPLDKTFSQTQPIINTSAVGSQYFWVNNTIAHCESEKLKITINTLPNPTVTATTPDVICFGDTLQVQLNFQGMPSFTLVYENQGIQKTFNSKTEDNTISLVPNNDGNIKFIAVTDSFCTTSYLNFMQSYLVNQLPKVTVQAKDTICNNQNIALNVQMDVANANFQWTNDNKPAFTKAQTVYIDNTQLSQQINNLSKVPQKITYTIKGYHGNCLGETASKSIVIMPSYEPELPTEDPTVCKGEEYTLAIPTPNVGYQIKWLKNDTLLQSTASTITEKISKNSAFTLQYTDYCGSTEERYLNVYIHEKQSLSKFQLIDSCLHFNGTIKASIPNYLNKTVWQINNDAAIEKPNSASETTVNYNFPAIGKNSINVKGYLNSCLLLDSTLVVDIINCDLATKNTFTPNDDGQNDLWEIKGIEKYTNASIEIFDRWGRKIKVIHKNIPLQAWDGKNEDGTTVEAGTYYYLINCAHPSIHIKGYINVFK